jgi:pimeloyl-ACP methyl ester carboxylesterase
VDAVTSLSSPDLPADVADALAGPARGRRFTVDAAGIPFSALEWGDPGGPPLLLLHGVTASGAVWWRMGPALAATGRRVVAPDMPGHGLTGHWVGHHRFVDNAADLAAFARAAGLVRPELQVVGHSWGAMTAAALPMAGLRPSTLVLIDPPALPHKEIAAMVEEDAERPYDDLAEATAAVRFANPTWSDGDVAAKAEALIQVDADAARSVLVDNGDFDGGLAALSDATAASVDAWLIRGDPDAGGLIPDEALPALAERVGADHVVTIPGAPHSPQRTHPAQTLAVLLRALGSSPG